MLYPYSVGKEYSFRAAVHSDESFVKSLFENDTRVDLGHGLYTAAVPCCENCRIGKLPGLLILRDAQVYGHKLLNDHRAVLDYPTRDIPAPTVLRFEEKSGARVRAITEFFATRMSIVMAAKKMEENKEESKVDKRVELLIRARHQR